MNPVAPGGRLYVKRPTQTDIEGSQRLRPLLGALVATSRAAQIPVVLTADWHTMESPEIDANTPNFQTTFPPHCMGGETDDALQAGARIIADIELLRPVVLPATQSAAVAMLATEYAIAAQYPLLVQKDQFSVFTGTEGVDGVLGALQRAAASRGAPLEIVVCGVASDVCVKAAVEGFLARGIQVRALEDAMEGLDVVPRETLFAEWASAGVQMDTASQWMNAQVHVETPHALARHNVSAQRRGR